MTVPRLTMRLLGRPAMFLDGAELELPQPKLLALLAYLAVQRRPCERDAVAELLWGMGRSRNLRTALYKLRQMPGAEAWLQAEEALALHVETDLGALEDALRTERFDTVMPEPPEGILLDGLDGDTDAYKAWLGDERTRVAELLRDVLAGTVQAAERRGDLDTALALARKLVRLEPFDEAAQRMTMRLEHGRGHTEAALWQFERFRKRLLDELGSEPEAATIALVHDIERGLLSASERAQRFEKDSDVWFRSNALFGRQALLSDLITALKRGGWVQLHGLGGIGKTALAAEAAATWLAEGGAPVLWATAAGDDAEALTDTLARALDERDEGRGADRGPDRGSASAVLARADDKVGALRGLLGSANVGLVVLDDARNPYVLGRALEAMPAGVAVLVTARRRYGGLARVPVDALTPADGVALLEHHAGRPLGEEGAHLSDRLGAHPFALRVAGVRLQRSNAAVQDVMADIDNALETLGPPPEQAEPGHENVAALLDASLQMVSDDAFDAFLAIGGLFAPSVTAELLGRVLRRPADQVEEALFELGTWALTERLVEPGRDVVRYRLHDLAFAFARSRGTIRTRSAISACKEHAVANASDLAALDADIANLIGAAAEAGRNRQPANLVAIVYALAVSGTYLETRGATPRALSLLALAAEAAEAGGDALHAHHLWSKLGNVQRERNADFEAALASYERALDLAKALHDPDREAILSCIIGVTLAYLGRPGASERLVDALDLARARGKPTTLLHVLQNVGGVAGLRGDAAEALRYSEEAVRAARAIVESEGLHPTGPALAYALLNQAEALSDLGRHAQAKTLLEEALVLARRLEHSLLEGFACQALGELHHATGDTLKARELLRDAHDLYRRSHAGAELAKLDKLWRTLEPSSTVPLQPLGAER